MRPKKLDDFVGVWNLTRNIDDRRAGQVGHANGRAVLSPGAQGLVYDEEITLHLPGQLPLQGRRRYLWQAVGDGISINFADGRAFHTLTLAGDTPKAAHWCDPDQYEVTYDFNDWPGWRSHWRVRGPKKDYLMETLYAPIPGGNTA